MEGQALRKNQLGTESTDPIAPTGLKRLAPESKGLLKEVEQHLKNKAKQKETLEQKKRRILEKCGCL